MTPQSPSTDKGKDDFMTGAPSDHGTLLPGTPSQTPAERSHGESAGGALNGFHYRRALRPSDGGYDYAIHAEIDGKQRVIAETFEVVGEGVRVDALANARLFVAAPDLVAALKLLLADVKDYAAWQRPCRAVEVAEAAITKAQVQS